MQGARCSLKLTPRPAATDFYRTGLIRALGTDTLLDVHAQKPGVLVTQQTFYSLNIQKVYLPPASLYAASGFGKTPRSRGEFLP